MFREYSGVPRCSAATKKLKSSLLHYFCMMLVIKDNPVWSDLSTLFQKSCLFRCSTVNLSRAPVLFLDGRI